MINSVKLKSREKLGNNIGNIVFYYLAVYNFLYHLQVSAIDKFEEIY